nr:hypothetical protein [Tanacetum cinerariifolium]
MANVKSNPNHPPGFHKKQLYRSSGSISTPSSSTVDKSLAFFLPGTCIVGAEPGLAVTLSLASLNFSL